MARIQPAPPHPTRTTAAPKVLVLGRDSRSFLAVVRSLGRRGASVHVAWCPADDLALRSRYIAEIQDIPIPEAVSGPWVAALEELVRRERYDLIIPTNDEAVVALRAERARFADLARVYQLNERAFEVAYDKHATGELARELGIPFPEERLLSEAVDGPSLLAELGTPLVLKPRHSFDFDRVKWEHQVRKVRDERELDVAARALLDQGEVLAQRNVPGRGVGVEILAEGGEILLAFQHERLHEPLQGGGSSYRRSQALDTDLLDAVTKLARALEYTGVGMFEFKREPSTKRWWLIEINARFWGSLPLALAAGVDFPWALYGLLVEGRREFLREYEPGVTCRNPSIDWPWLWRNLRADRRDPDLATVGRWQLAGELVPLLTLREHFDSFARDDPRPGFEESRRVAVDLARVVGAKLVRLPYRLAPLRHLMTRATRGAVREMRSVLFVCKGNICRSPFAAALAARALPDDIQVESSGTYPESGRRVPSEAIAAAAAHGVDLTASRSSRLTREMLERADLVFVFDSANLARLASEFPESRSKLHRLGTLAPSGSVNIRDPYGGGLAAFEWAYAEIAAAIECVAALLPPRCDTAPKTAVAEESRA